MKRLLTILMAAVMAAFTLAACANPSPNEALSKLLAVAPESEKSALTASSLVAGELFHNLRELLIDHFLPFYSLVRLANFLLRVHQQYSGDVQGIIQEDYSSIA